MRAGRWRADLPLLAGVVALVLLYIVAAVRYRELHFATGGVAINLFSDNAVLGIAAVGMAIVVITGSIDLSLGAVMGLTTVIIATLMADHGWPGWCAAPVAVLIAMGFGAVQGAIIHGAKLPAFIVTLAGLFIARGAALVIHLEPVAIVGDPTYTWLLGTGIEIGDLKVPVNVMLLVAVTLAAWFMLRKTRLGRRMYALGGSEEACIAAGVRVGRVRIAAHALSGLCAGLAGFAMTLYLPEGSHTEGVGLELDALAAVVIGGVALRGGRGSALGGLVGTLVIGLILVCITTYETHQMTSGLTKALIGGLLLAFVLLQRGLGVT